MYTLKAADEPDDEPCLEDLGMLVSFKVLIASARFLLIITCTQINLYALSQLNLHVCNQIYLHACKLIWLYMPVATYPLEIISASTANSKAMQWLQVFAAKEFM